MIAVFLANIVFFMTAVVGLAEDVNWDYGPTTHSLTLATGDYVEVTVQGISNISLINKGTTTSTASYGYPIQLTLLEVYGHYSNKREPYVVTGQVIPGSGPVNGWFRVNALDAFVYHNCSDVPSENYVVGSAINIWKPEQSGELKVTGSGNVLPEDCPVHYELAKLRFQGHDGTKVVREIYIDVKGSRPLPTAPPDDPGDPDYAFNLNFSSQAPGPPGENLLPPDDDAPPYDEEGPGDPEETAYDDAALGDQEETGDGPGVCSAFGLPVYRVDAAHRGLEITDRMFAYTSLGPDVSIGHTHNSRKESNGMFGPRWHFSYEQKVVPIYSARAQGGGLDLTTWVDPAATPEAASVHLGNGRVSRFAYKETTPAGEKVYKPEDPYLKAELVLLPNPGGWELRWQNPRLTYRFARVPTLVTYPVGRLSSISDPFGNNLTFTYVNNTNGSDRSFWLIEKVTDAAGRVATFQYTDGLCTRVTMPNGLFASYVYDANACLTQTTDLLGNVVTYTYSAEQALTGMASAGKTVQFVYDAERRVTQVVNAQGQTTTYSNPSAIEIGFTSAAGYALTTTFNGDGLPIAQTNALGQSTTLNYVEKRPSEVVKVGNRRSTVGHDAAGNRIRHENALGQTTTRVFDAKNRLVSLTNALGQKLTFTYGLQDQLLSVTRPSGAKITYEYNAKGLLVAMTNELGGVTRYAYDTYGNLVETTSPTNGKTTHRYDAHGLYRTAIVNPNGHETTFTYDQNGRMTQFHSPDNTTQSFHYDSWSLTGMTDVFGQTYAIDRNDSLYVTKYTAPSGGSTSLAYDADGRQTQLSSSAGQSYSSTFDALGRPSSLITPAGTYTFSYDDMWNIKAITTPAEKTWNFIYNAARQLVSEQDPLGRVTSYNRDALGRLTKTTNADGSTVTNTYTVDGDPATLTVGTTDTYTNEYNAAGWLTRQQTPLGNNTFRYDAAGRVTQIDYPGGLAIRKTYDPNGNLTGLTYPDNTTVFYQFDTRERLNRLSWNGGSVNLSYDLASRLTGITRGNGVNTVMQRAANGRLTALTHASSAGMLAQINLTRDPLGRITQSTIDSDVLPGPNFIGERTAALTYNAADGLATFAGDAVQSDVNGNVTAIPALAATYTYDALNRIKTITTAEGMTQLTYDGLNRVVRLQAPEQTVRFFYDERSRLLFSTDDQNNLLWYNIYAGLILMAQDSPDSGPRYYHSSDLGHTLAVTDHNGSVIDSFAYTPLGMSTQSFQPSREWFTLSGSFAVIDLGHGHYHMRHRLYHAALGRFLQRDPIGMAGGVNLYAYSGSDPVNGVDPFGLAGWLDDDVAAMREDYDNQKEREKREDYSKKLVKQWDLEKKEAEQYRKENPIKSWATEQIGSKGLAFATGGLSEVADAYIKYQQGQYFDMLADRFPGVGETKSLLENLDNSYGIKDKLFPPNSDSSYNNLGGGGGPQCLMVPVHY